MEVHFGLPDLLGLLVSSVDHHRGFSLTGEAEVPLGVDCASLVHPEIRGLSNVEPHLSSTAVREAH